MDWTDLNIARSWLSSAAFGHVWLCIKTTMSTGRLKWHDVKTKMGDSYCHQSGITVTTWFKGPAQFTFHVDPIPINHLVRDRL